MAKGIFITGTGTDVGKTYVTALIVKKLHDSGINCAYYKAAVSGNERSKDGKLIPGDADFVRNVSGISQPLSSMCPYVYERAVSPHLASAIEGDPVDLQLVRSGYNALADRYDVITMEGSGGIVCPLRSDNEGIILLEDIVKLLDLPCIIVADAGLGTINHVVLTVEYMRARNIDIRGIILNRFHCGNVMEKDNKEMIRRLTGVPVIACVSENCTDISIPSDELLPLYGK